jgi:tetratricopeptide (TPR) repeat protein
MFGGKGIMGMHWIRVAPRKLVFNLFKPCAATLLLVIAPYDLCRGGQRSPDAELHAKRAQAAIASNRPDVASTELKALIHLEPNDINARASLGMVLFTQRHYDEAAKNFGVVLVRSPSLWNAKAFLGMCQIRLGRADEGRSDIEDALPKLTDRVLREQAGLELIKSYTEGGDEDRAAHIIETLQHDDPENPDLLFAAYRIHSALASAALQKFSQTSPDSARIHQVLGDDMLLQENFQGAIGEYKEALKLDPHLIGVHLTLGEAMLAQGGKTQNASSAESEFQAELAVDPGNPDALLQLGEIALRRGDQNSAARLFTESLERRPSSSEAHIALAKISSDRNQDAAAIEHLQAALKTEPKSRTAHYRLAQLYSKSGDSVKAAQEFEIARRLAAIENHKMPLTRHQDLDQ